jgi:hypothetical protein
MIDPTYMYFNCENFMVHYSQIQHAFSHRKSTKKKIYGLVDVDVAYNR